MNIGTVRRFFTVRERDVNLQLGIMKREEKTSREFIIIFKQWSGLT